MNDFLNFGIMSFFLVIFSESFVTKSTYYLLVFSAFSRFVTKFAQNIVFDITSACSGAAGQRGNEQRHTHGCKKKFPPPAGRRGSLAVSFSFYSL
jgi:hypothetical protein